MNHNDTVRKLIRELEEEAKVIDRKLRTAYAMLGQPQPRTTKAVEVAKGRPKRLVFVVTLEPHLKEQGPLTLKQLHAYLRKQPGMRAVTFDSLKGTLYQELKKVNSRLFKTEDGRIGVHTVESLLASAVLTNAPSPSPLMADEEQVMTRGD